MTTSRSALATLIRNGSCGCYSRAIASFESGARLRLASFSVKIDTNKIKTKEK